MKAGPRNGRRRRSLPPRPCPERTAAADSNVLASPHFSLGFSILLRSVPGRRENAALLPVTFPQVAAPTSGLILRQSEQLACLDPHRGKTRQKEDRRGNAAQRTRRDSERGAQF